MATYYRWRKSTVIYKEHLGADTTAYDLTYYNSNCYIQWGYDYDVDTSNGEYTVTNQVGSITLSAGENVKISSPYNAIFYDHLNSVYVRVYTKNYGATISLNNNKLFIRAVTASTFTFNQLLPQANSFVEYVYSINGSFYPNGKVKEGYYYDQRTTVTSPTAPSGITYPATITTPSVSISWTAATSNISNFPVASYEVSYSSNGGTSWTVAGTTESTSYSFDIPVGITSIMFRARAKDTNGNWGDYVTGTVSQVLAAPTLTVPQMVMQGQQATISWTAVDGADSYTLQRKSSADEDWTQVYSGTGLSYTETVGTWTSLQYRVQAVFDETPGGWATSGEIQIVSASALVISGSDGDLGTITDDVLYTVSSNNTGTITVIETISDIDIRTYTATSGEANRISVIDLPTGGRTIKITASITIDNSPITVTRSWHYSKTAPTFGNTGSLAQLTQGGNDIWSKTIAEAVRAPSEWGGNLGIALQKLLRAVLYDPDTGNFLDLDGSISSIPIGKIETGSYVGTGNTKVTISVSSGTPVAIIVIGLGSRNSTNEYYGTLTAIKGFDRVVAAYGGGFNTNATCSFNNNSISWSKSGGEFNLNGQSYTYIILCT